MVIGGGNALKVFTIVYQKKQGFSLDMSTSKACVLE